MSSITQDRRGRPVTPEEARESAKRFIDHYFGNQGKRPKISIPVEYDDDDVQLHDFIAEKNGRS